MLMSCKHDMTPTTPRTVKILKMTSMFLEQKIFFKMVYYALHLKSCYKVRIYTDEKVTFLKGAWHLKGKGNKSN